jgi:transketolase
LKPLREVFADTLIRLADSNPNVLVLDADLANSTKADRFAAAHPDQFLEMGIAEQNMVGVAAGLSSLGYIPWLSSFAVFFTHRAVDPIRMLVAQSNANVKIGAAYSGSVDGIYRQDSPGRPGSGHHAHHARNDCPRARGRIRM